MTIISFTLTLVFAGVLMLNNAFGNADLNIVLKTTTSLFFVLTPILAYLKAPKNKKYFFIILTGLVFSLLGDVFLALTYSWSFNVGVLAFTLAQISFSVAFTYLERVKLNDILLFLIIAGSLLFLECFVDYFDFDGKFPLIIIYTFIISFMVVKAYSLLRIKKGSKFSIVLTVIAMTSFFISDFFLLFVYFFNKEFNILPYMNTVFYYSAQALLGLSFIKQIKYYDN